jgi:hypothetical protein
MQFLGVALVLHSRGAAGRRNVGFEQESFVINANRFPEK